MGSEKQGRENYEKEKKDFPQPNFIGFVSGLYTQTLLAMGLVQNPETGEHRTDLKEAQFLIDTLGMLEKKTSGNLSDEEADHLKNVLNDVRMRYVEAAGRRRQHSDDRGHEAKSDKNTGPEN